MIPRLLHRTVPAETPRQTEACWQTAVDLHPGWEHRTWRDPLDPADFPTTSPHWHRCTTGAQLAGLVRLEVLCRFGGVYLDSDVELFRSLDPLVGVSAFAGWEDANVVPDAVLGAEPDHPAIAACLDLALRRLCSTSDDWRTGNGAWSTGPGVTTTLLPGRCDVLLLPPGSFYEIHYTEKARLGEAPMPWELGRHHWAASWL